MTSSIVASQDQTEHKHFEAFMLLWAILISIIRNYFNHLSIKISGWAGSAAAFVIAIAVVLVWLITGPYFDFSDTWLITITVITDVIIFVMVFCIQNTQNRDSKAIRLKLNELIAADKGARDAFIGLESLTDNEIAVLDGEFKQLLTKLDVHPVIHKLHKKIAEEKAHRPGFSEQAEHLVETILGPLGNKPGDKE